MTWFVKIKCVELDLAENKELWKESWGKVRMGRPVYDTNLMMGDLVCQDKMC